MKSQLPALMIPKGCTAQPDGGPGAVANANVSPDRAAVDGAADGANVRSMGNASDCFEPQLYRVAPPVRSKKKRFG
jgi:hypothetical protein